MLVPEIDSESLEDIELLASTTEPTPNEDTRSPAELTFSSVVLIPESVITTFLERLSEGIVREVASTRELALTEMLADLDSERRFRVEVP